MVVWLLGAGGGGISMERDSRRTAHAYWGRSVWSGTAEEQRMRTGAITSRSSGYWVTHVEEPIMALGGSSVERSQGCWRLSVGL